MIHVLVTVVLWWLMWIVVAGLTMSLVAAFAMMFMDKGDRKPRRDDSGFGGPWE